MTRPFTDKRSRRLLAAFLVSELGDGITAVVVPLGVYAVSDSVVALASTFLGRMLAGSLFAAFGGTIADFVDRRRLLLISYLLRAALVALLIPVSGWSPAVFAVIGIFVGAAGSFDNPAAESALRASYRHDLQSLAAARKSGKTVSAMIGPAIGGLLFGIGGLPLSLGINVVTFLLALAFLSGRRSLPTGVERTPATAVERTPPTAVEPTPATAVEPTPAGDKEGVKTAAKIAGYRIQVPPVVTMSFLSAASASFLVGVATVLAVPYLADLARAPEGAYGFALAAYSVGALAGLWLAGIGSWTRIGLKTILILSAIVFGALTMLSVSAPRWEIFATAWFIWGIAFGPEDVVSDSRVASVVADRWLGRVYALWSILGKLGAAGAYVLVIVLGNVDAPSVLMTIGLAYAVVVPVLLFLLPREPRPRRL